MDVKYPVWKQELPKFPHKMYNEPLEQLVEFYKEQHQERREERQAASCRVLGGRASLSCERYANLRRHLHTIGRKAAEATDLAGWNS